MAGSTRAVWKNYSSGREELGKNKSVKRVTFLEDDMVVIIPSNEDLEDTKTFTTIPRCRIPGPIRLSSSSSHTATGLVRVGPNSSLKSQTVQKQFLRAGDHGSLRTKEKQVKSILKKSSAQSCLQNSRFYDSYRGISIDSPSIKYKVGVDQQEEKPRLNFGFYVKNKERSEGSDSYSDFLKRQTRGNTESPQPSTGSSFYKTSFSPNRTFVQRHGSFNVARPLKSTSPEEQHRKSEILSKQSSPIRNCKSDVLGVVGNMLNVSDLYPVLSNLQKNSLSLSDSSLSKHQGMGAGRYIPTRELISRNGPGSNAYARHTKNATQNASAALRSSKNLTQSNVSARASAGLGRAAELSLLNRLRKFERNDPPYLAWQTERNISSSPNMTAVHTRASSLTSVYGGSLGSRISTALEKPSSALRSPGNSQYYY